MRKYAAHVHELQTLFYTHLLGTGTSNPENIHEAHLCFRHTTEATRRKSLNF